MFNDEEILQHIYTEITDVVFLKNGEVWSRDMDEYQIVAKDVMQVACGERHIIILNEDGEAWGCGDTKYPGRNYNIQKPLICIASLL
jgi:alpha-tubulin suppressor-like RCC1 family protein